MILVRVIGGLGNQMFQYAVGRALSLQHRVPLKLDVSAYASYETHTFALDKLSITSEFATQDELDNVASHGMVTRLLRRALHRSKTVQRIQERSFDFDARVTKLAPPLYLDGYWQSEKYFRAYATVLREELQPHEPAAAVNAAIAAEMDACESIALHVRRGDYISNPEANAVHGMCDVAYYQDAVRMITWTIASPRLFVFSDEPEWAKANLRFDHPTSFIDANPPSEGHWDMWLMAQCRHQIIANSSFSWWAAWLNRNPAKRVIAPKRWFRTNVTTNDLIPDGWLRLGQT